MFYKPDELQVVVRAWKSMDPDRGENWAHFKFEDTVATVYESTEPDAKEIGYIAGCIGGPIELKDELTGCTWTIDVGDLWHAFQNALKGEKDREIYGEA